MEIRLRENIYITSGQSYVIPRGANGVFIKRTVHFYDTTKTVSIGIDRDTCLQCPELFSVKRQLNDRDISQKELLGVVSDCSKMFKSEDDFNRFSEIIKSL